MPSATETCLTTSVSEAKVEVVETNGSSNGVVKPINVPTKESDAPPAITPTRSEHRFATTSYPSNCLQFLQQLNLEADTSPLQPVQARLKLEIVVVGAGLGGLATAVGLARRGHKVTVLEQAPQLAEVGAGIQVPPNCSKLLQRWGVIHELDGQAVRPDGISFRRWQNGDRIGFTDLSQSFVDTCGAPYYVVHRAHLHSALHKRAVDLGVVVRLNSRVIDYDDSVPSVKLVDGQEFEADLVIAADGIRSVARKHISPGPRGKPKPTGFAAYRATVDVKRMKDVPEIAWILEKPALNIWIGEDRHVMTYTIAAGESFNMVLSHRDAGDPATWAQMSQQEIIQDMRDEFQDWDPQLVKIIELIDNTLKWPLIGGNSLETWTSKSSRLVTLGDAAHAMLPYMSQGAAMAIEDGAALAIVLNNIASTAELPHALDVFQTERMQRTRRMQEASMVNAMLWHYKDGPEQQARDEAMLPEVEGRHFLASPNQWSDPLTQSWAYGYDAEKIMQERWDASLRDLIRHGKI